MTQTIQSPMTDREIDRVVERRRAEAMDRYSRREITAEDYEEVCRQADDWALAQVNYRDSLEDH